MTDAEESGLGRRLDQLKMKAAEPVREVLRAIHDRLVPPSNTPRTGQFTLYAYQQVWARLREKVARKALGLPDDAEISFTRGRVKLSEGGGALPPSLRKWQLSLDPNSEPLDDEQVAKLLSFLLENEAVPIEFATQASGWFVTAWGHYQLTRAAISHSHLQGRTVATGACSGEKGTYRLLKFVPLENSPEECAVYVKLGLPEKGKKEAIGKGMGLLGAFMNAVKQITGRDDIEVEGYRSEAIGPGADAKGEVSFTLRLGERSFQRRGTGSNLVWAAVEEVIKGLNLERAAMQVRMEGLSRN